MNITLTTAPQVIVNSQQGCLITSDDSFYYSFGVTQPSKDNAAIWHNASEPLEYGGKYGKIWVWKLSESFNTYISYWISGGTQ